MDNVVFAMVDKDGGRNYDLEMRACEEGVIFRLSEYGKQLIVAETEPLRPDIDYESLTDPILRILMTAVRINK